MSHITEFSITGLAGRDGVYRQQLNRDVNVFFGLNGSGKTSLLKIMDSAMSGDAKSLEAVPFKSAEVKFYSINFDKVYTRRVIKPKSTRTTGSKGSVVSDAPIDSGVWLVDNQSTPDLKWTTTPKLPDSAHYGFASSYLPTSRLYVGHNAANYAYLSGVAMGENQSPEEALDSYFARSLESLWTSYSADVLSQVNKAQQDGLASILKAVLTVKPPKIKESQKIDSETAFERVDNFLRRQGSSEILGSIEDFKERYKEDAKLRSVVIDINEVEHGIEIAMAPRNKLQALIQKMFGETKIRFQDKGIEITARDKTKIDLTSLSSGQKHVLKIFIETLLAARSSLMIDEPEISIHIDWQRILITSMHQLNPFTQIIVATHSPEIMADIPDDKIFHL